MGAAGFALFRSAMLEASFGAGFTPPNPALRATGSFPCKVKSQTNAWDLTLVEIQGLKPWTSALPALRSNQLSYIPSMNCQWTMCGYQKLIAGVD